MNTFETAFLNVDISTRPKRRKAVSQVVRWLGSVYMREFEYLGRIPENLHSGDAYAAADHSLDMLDEAMTYLIEAYDIPSSLL